MTARGDLADEPLMQLGMHASLVTDRGLTGERSDDSESESDQEYSHDMDSDPELDDEQYPGLGGM